MNSDPYDSAAWRTFGMLNADEAAIFDDAMRDDPALRKYSLEMDRLSAAIAASMVTPIQPEPGELAHIQSRAGLPPLRRVGNWLAVTGWAAAAVMAVILVAGRRETTDRTPTAGRAPASEPVSVPTASGDKPATMVVAQRLTQEIEVLRQNLEEFQHRDRVLFAPLPGRAVPIVMTMTPPGEPTSDFPITTLLGDAIKAAMSPHEEPEETTEPDIETSADTPPALPSAMPIYDTARDSGTLVVSNLPEPGENEVYNLWVITDLGGRPVYVGSLPESRADGTVSFDFSLGSTMIMPSGFILTRDPLNAPAAPTANNIILQGPPPPAR